MVRCFSNLNSVTFELYMEVLYDCFQFELWERSVMEFRLKLCFWHYNLKLTKDVCTDIYLVNSACH